MRRHAKRFAKPPLDPRARRVVSHFKKGASYVLELDCGHAQLRRLMSIPRMVVCTDCPPAGGIGGHYFERGK